LERMLPRLHRPLRTWILTVPFIFSARYAVIDANEQVVIDANSIAGNRGSMQNNDIFPSGRCANREEWKEVCKVWSGRPHHRYIKYDTLRGVEGIGATLLRVKWALDHAIAFDLEPVFVGSFTAGHHLGDFGDFMGLTHSPYFSIQDVEALEMATEITVPFPKGNENDWFLQQENRTNVIYSVEAMEVAKDKNWGIPVFPPNSNPRVCRYAREILRDMYWTAPRIRGRCFTFLPDDHEMQPDVGALKAKGYRETDRKRPWVIAVHVRRGDMVHFRSGVRSVPHRYFSSTMGAVLQGIAVIDPAAYVTVLVFSEGPRSMSGLQLPDEHGKAITWDIEEESCLEVGLNCSQVKR